MSSLTQFRPNDDLPPDFMLIMYGMRRSGKTTALLHMLEEMKERFKHHKVHVFSGTANENPAQWRNFPPSCVSADIGNIDVAIGHILNEQQELIREEVNRQLSERTIKKKRKASKPPPTTDLVKKNKQVRAVGNEGAIQNDTEAFQQEMEVTNGVINVTDEEVNELRRNGQVDESRFPRRLLILDDVVNDHSIRHSINLNKLAVSGRHIFITCIILSQCVCGSASVPPIIRRNSDYIMVVGNPRSTHERKLLATDYLTISNESGASDKALRLLADVTKQKYRIFVIDVTNSIATEYNQFLFKYGPVPSPPNNVSKQFKMGTSNQWDDWMHHGNREPKYTKADNPKKSKMFRGKLLEPIASESSVPEFFDPLF
jgi:hypothetical protein